MRETRIETGRVRGIACGWPAITAYYGIPYAAPPVGELRWRPPQPPESWEGVRDCVRPGSPCPQMSVSPFYKKEFYPVEEPKDEDCLYLNVWTPAQSADEKIPVLFWVHGGAFMTGYGHSAHFDGEAYARQGIVVVTINYRLNIFGWMVHPELTAESEHHSSGNYGLLDQIAALKWTRRNIAAFGGDPDHITIAGQSAGAMCIQALLSSPMTEGMVKGAIMQSGGGVTAAPDMRYIPLAQAEAETDLSLLGVSSIAEARALPWQELFDRWAKSFPQPGLRRAPVTDGWVLPLTLEEAARTGQFRQVPCIIGCTSKEGIMAAPTYGIWKEMLTAEYGPERAEEFAALHNKEEGFADYSTVHHFTDHCRAAAEAWALQLERLKTGPGYVFWLDRQLPGDDMGPFHAADLWYTWKTFTRSWRPWTGADYELAAACTTYWGEFIKHGVPQGPGLPEWTPYTEEDPRVMEMGEHIGMISLPEEPRVTFRKQFLLDG